MNDLIILDMTVNDIDGRIDEFETSSNFAVLNTLTLT